MAGDRWHLPMQINEWGALVLICTMLECVLRLIKANLCTWYYVFMEHFNASNCLMESDTHTLSPLEGSLIEKISY